MNLVFVTEIGENAQSDIINNAREALKLEVAAERHLNEAKGLRRQANERRSKIMEWLPGVGQTVMVKIPNRGMYQITRSGQNEIQIVQAFIATGVKKSAKSETPE